MSRSVIFMMLIATWCYIGIWGVQNPSVELDILVPKKIGLLGRLFNQNNLSIVKVTGGILLMQWFQIM